MADNAADELLQNEMIDEGIVADGFEADLVEGAAEAAETAEGAEATEIVGEIAEAAAACL